MSLGSARVQSSITCSGAGAEWTKKMSGVWRHEIEHSF